MVHLFLVAILLSYVDKLDASTSLVNDTNTPILHSATYFRHNFVASKPKSVLARRIVKALEQPKHRSVRFMFPDSGLGSNLHVWSQMLCVALQQNATIDYHGIHVWSWRYKTFCPTLKCNDPLTCYFDLHQGHSCPNIFSEKVHFQIGNSYDMCPDWIFNVESRELFRSAAMEYLFSHTKDTVAAKAEEFMRAAFNGPIPKDLIAVHIRWGDDKAREVGSIVHADNPKIVRSINDYVVHVETLVKNFSIPSPVHIFLSTESPQAQSQFLSLVQKVHQKDWIIYHYDAAISGQRTPMLEAKRSRGKAGFDSLVALLITLQAKYYVLTTTSNWSRLINELRISAVDLNCGNCTVMIDAEYLPELYWRS